MRSDPAKAGAASGKGPADTAIDDIVDMKPQRVEVSLLLPVAAPNARAVVKLEWSREDTNMPLSELLKRIETYVAKFGSA
ncbi:MAG TPA: hypothetical protein VLY85_01085 [Thermoplasmata archaeon]|nr:hypothetical protein [Thermoplasmata archaeon]